MNSGRNSDGHKVEKMHIGRVDFQVKRLRPDHQTRRRGYSTRKTHRHRRVFIKLHIKPRKAKKRSKKKLGQFSKSVSLPVTVVRKTHRHRPPRFLLKRHPEMVTKSKKCLTDKSIFKETTSPRPLYPPPPPRVFEVNNAPSPPPV